MDDEIIGEAAQETAAEGGAVILIPNLEAESEEQAPLAETVVPCCPHCADNVVRIVTLEMRVDEHVATINRLAADLDSRAMNEHSHPVDDDVRIVAEELRELRQEETAPRRGIVQRGWLARWARGKRVS